MSESPSASRTLAGGSKSRSRRSLIVIALASVFGLIVFAIPLAGISPWAHRVLAIVATALVLWIGEGLDIAVTSLAVIALLAIFGPGESSKATRDALYGFQLPAGYFVLCTLAVATASRAVWQPGWPGCSSLERVAALVACICSSSSSCLRSP